MLALTSFVSLLAAASSVTAAPHLSKRGASFKECQISAVPDLPSGQSTLAISSGQKPLHVGLGVGVQNYTCTSTGVYSSIGALAELFDISCISFDDPLFENIQTEAYGIWNKTPGVSTLGLEAALGSGYPVLGQHYFIVNPFTGNGLSPVFDFRDGIDAGDSSAFIVTNKTGDIAAPTGKQDVDWLQLVTAQGTVAKTVFRLDTRYGQPPSSCTPGSPVLSVKYTAKYWFYG